MKPVRRAGVILFSAALALLVNSTLAHAQDRGRGGKAQAEPPTLKGKVAAYEADASITLETKVRGGQVNKTEFSIVRGKTQIEWGAGVKAIEPGGVVSVWADKDNPKNAARILAEPEAPTVKGKVTAFEADKSITVETKSRSGEAKNTEFAIAKDKTRIELGAGVKAIEPGGVVSVWAEKENSKNAARIAVQGAAPAGRNRGGARAVPPEPAKPAVPAPAPQAEDPVDVKKVLDAYESFKPTEEQLRIYRLRWTVTLKEAKELAAKEGRPVLLNVVGSFHGNAFTGHI